MAEVVNLLSKDDDIRRECDSVKLSRDTLKALALINQIGLSMMIPIGIGLFLGIFLDKRLGTAPLFLLILLLLGMLTSFRNLYVLTKSFRQDKGREMNNDHQKDD